MMGLIGIVLLVLGVGYLAGIAGFFLALNQRSRIDRLEVLLGEAAHRENDLAAKLRRLEAAPKPAEAAEQGDASSPKVRRRTDPSPAAPAEPVTGRAHEPVQEPTPTTAGPWQEALSTRTSSGMDAPRNIGLEERLGTRWAVWVGGAALALGALLLVRYTIEQGLVGPEMRVVLGALLAAGLVAAGEWLRRSEIALPLTGLAGASIPAVLTAAGTVAAFGTVYAAHALYGFIGSGGAFTLMGAIGLAALWAAELHGAPLAGLGLVGAMAAPALVSSDVPNPWPVIVYLAVVAVSAHFLARRKSWPWLAEAASLGGLVWGFLFADLIPGDEAWGPPAMVLGLVQAAIAASFLAWHAGARDNAESADPDVRATALLSAFGLLAVVVLAAHSSVSAATVTYAVLTCGLLALAACRREAVALALPAAGVTGLLALLVWPSFAGSRFDPLPGLDAGPDLFTLPLAPGWFVLAALVLGLVPAALAALRLFARPVASGLAAASYAGTAALVPLAILALVYGRVANFNASIVFAITAALLAVLFAAAAGVFQAKEQTDGTEAVKLGTGALAAAAVAAIAMGLVFYLDRGMLTVALAIAALATAVMADLKKIGSLRYAVSALGLAVALRFAWDPSVMGSDLGPTPVFNWLLFGYGVPAATFFAAARILEKDCTDVSVEVADALALAFLAFLVFFEIRHYMNAGDVMAAGSSHSEQGLLALAAIALALAVLKSRLASLNVVFRYASLVFAGIAGLSIAAGLGLFENPYVTDEPIARAGIFSSLWLAYLLPGLAAAYLARAARGAWPEIAVRAAGILALALVFGFVTLEVRHGAQGANIGFWRSTSDPEFWSYSAAWLMLGAALLAYGLWRGMLEARIASAGLVTLVVIKVFLLDLAGLEGVLRALSFIGLGLVLLAIGYVYQRFVFAGVDGTVETRSS